MTRECREVGKDWVAWHAAYGDPQSALSERLAVVVRMIRSSLDDAPPGPLRCLSLCAGEARDLAAAVVDHPRAADVTGVAVELDAHLAANAIANLVAAGVDVDVRVGDAGDPSTFADVVPVDVLVLAGIFGNVSDADVRTTVEAATVMCRPGASVIWTRHRRPPDLTDHIRRWFDLAGAASVEFESGGPGGYGVGRERITTPTPLRALPPRLFTFTTAE